MKREYSREDTRSGGAFRKSRWLGLFFGGYGLRRRKGVFGSRTGRAGRWSCWGMRRRSRRSSSRSMCSGRLYEGVIDWVTLGIA